MTIKTRQELFDEFMEAMQSPPSPITDTNEGSITDIVAGATVQAASEIIQLALDEFAKTFFSTAHGPEVTGGPDDLETLAVDHFGDSFARPGAVKATGVVAFSRPNADAGNVTIGVGTIVKTAPDSNGVSQRFEVTAEVVMTGTTINASVRALVAGTAGNVNAATVTTVETTLTDPSVTVSNAADFEGGAETETDAEYRETIRNLLLTLKGATKAAIEAISKTVGGVETATAVEFRQYVKEWDIGADAPVGPYFVIPRVRLYIGDANGVASPTLISDVRAAVDLVRACGVFITILSGVALVLDWEAALTLDPAGPNFATLQTDATMILDTMAKYIQDLPVGATFVRATANAALLAIWGPDGTGDLVADGFATVAPVGDVDPAENIKLIPGAMTS